MKSVNLQTFLSVTYISFYSLTSRTRDDTVELISTENLLLWCSFVF